MATMEQPSRSMSTTQRAGLALGLVAVVLLAHQAYETAKLSEKLDDIAEQSRQAAMRDLEDDITDNV